MDLVRTLLTIPLLVALPGSAFAAAPRVELSPSEVTLGDEDPAAVTVTIRTESDVALDALVLRSTAGTPSAVEAVEPGVFRARLSPPAKSFPQLAVVTAAILQGDEPPAIDQAVVTYSARLTLNGKSEPGAHMQIQVGGRSYPEVAVAPDGSFRVPIEVRPGEQWATGVVRDRLGNRSATRINLYLPEVRRTHAFVQPQPVRVGSSAWLFLTTVSRSGAPEVRPGVFAAAQRGALSDAVPVGPGITRYRYRAPRQKAPGTDIVTLRGPTGGDEVRIPVALASGALHAITARGTRMPWDEAANVDVEGRDRFGNVVPLERVVLVDRVTQRTFEGTRLPPPGVEGTRSFEVRAYGPEGTVVTDALRVTWHRPLPVLLTMRWIGSSALRVESDDPAVLRRLDFAAVGVSLGERQLREGALVVEAHAPRADARVIARDPLTGTSVWIGAP